MDSFIATFHIDWKIIIAQMINFAIVFFILYFFALKPLKKLMAERTDRIEKGLIDAKNNSELLNKTQKEYDDVLAKAKNEAHSIFQEGKKEAEKKKSEILEDTNKEVEIMIENSKKLLEAEKIKMIEEAKKEIVSLVIKATEKLLDDKDTKKYDDKILSNIENI